MSRAAFKGRECVVYLPSAEDLQVWKEEAEIAGTSLSKYIFEMAQRGRRVSKGVAYKSDSTEEDRSKLVEENHAMREKLQNTSLLLEKARQDLEEFRVAQSADNTFVPLLISLFKNENSLSNENIIKSFDLKPNDNKMRDIFRTLNKLNEWHLIDSNARGGWKWIR